MLLAAMLVDALHAALEDAEIAFDGVGVRGATDVLDLAVVDALMAGELFADLAVMAGFIRHDGGIAPDVSDQHSPYRLGVDLIYMERPGKDVQLPHGDHLTLALGP